MSVHSFVLNRISHAYEAVKRLHNLTKRFIRPIAGFKNSSAKGERTQIQTVLIEILPYAEGRLTISRKINISAVFENKR
jgi:hypothetical protein